MLKSDLFNWFRLTSKFLKKSWEFNFFRLITDCGGILVIFLLLFFNMRKIRV